MILSCSTKCYHSGGSEEPYLLGYKALLHAYFMLVSCLAYSSTLKMEVSCYSKTSVDFQRTTQRYIPKDRSPHNLYNSCINTLE
jgi:hypothetical protein